MAEQEGMGAAAKRVRVHIPSPADVEERESADRARPRDLFRPPDSSPAAPAADGARPSSPPPPPANAFTDAFSFVRKSVFYSPPPPVPARSTPPPRPPPQAEAQAGDAPTTSAGKGASAGGAQAGQARNGILVSRRQQGNSVLKHVRNARWTYADIVPDYILGHSSCALYLSLRYHLLHPEYIYFRIRELQKSFRLRVVLCHVDVDDVIKPLQEVTKTCLLHDCSLLCAWSQEECARYLETIKIYENKPADYIQERTDGDYLSRLTSSLTTVRHVNKTDVLTLGSTFKTLAAVFNSSMEDLAKCPGIGERKVKRLYDAFNEPFRRVPILKVSAEGKSLSSACQGPDSSAVGLLNGKPTDKIDLDGPEAAPTSKLINRDAEASVSAAVTAARKKAGKIPVRNSQTFRSNSQLIPEVKTTDGDRTIHPGIHDEYVISLDD